MEHVYENSERPSVAVSSMDESALPGAAVDHMCAVAAEAAGVQARLLAAMVAVAGPSTRSGFDADVVAFALHLPRRVAEREVSLARDLVMRLPSVFAALSAGDICSARARVFSDVLGTVGDGLARQIADRFVVPAAECTSSQLRQRLLKAVLAADPDAARKRAERVELLVPLQTLTGQSDAPATLAGYGPVIADIARQVAAADGAAQPDPALAATAREAGAVVAPAPPMQWRYTSPRHRWHPSALRHYARPAPPRRPRLRRRTRTPRSPRWAVSRSAVAASRAMPIH